MREILIGEYIRERRKDLGLTQSALCEGLCEPSTLSRLERGVHAPTSGLVNPLLQRLGLPGGRFFALLNENEAAVEALQKEIRADGIRFRRASEDMRPIIWTEAMGKLKHLEELAGGEDRIVKQFILSTRATLGKLDGPYSYKERLDILMEAIQLTVPRFDLEEINCKRYSLDEITLINQIAVTYKRAGKRKQAIDIYRQLLAYIEKNNQELTGYAVEFCLVAQNYAIALSMEECFTKAIEVSEKGWRICVDYGNYQFLPGFLAILAECHYFTGDQAKSRKLYYQAFSIYDTLHDEHNRAIMQAEMKERLDLDAPY